MDDFQKKLLSLILLFLFPIILIIIFAPLFGFGIIVGFFGGLYIMATLMADRYEEEGDKMFEELKDQLKYLKRNKNDD